MRPARCALLILIPLAAVLLFATPALAITPPIAEADAVHTVNGEGKFSVFGLVGGSGTSYDFEFLTEEQLREGAWADAVSTPKVAGGGLVVQEIPALPPGETYRYRMSVESEAFPGVVVHSQVVRSLSIPAPAPEMTPACPNEALRKGPSARLPDCRAYEQVTPVDKEGAQDIFDYRSNESTVFGLDGERFFMTTTSKWGQNVSGASQSTYSFVRTPERWAMSSLSPQPQTGGVFNRPYGFYTPDLSQVLIERSWRTGYDVASPTVEFALGPPGGPYTTVASEPKEEEGVHHGHWVAQSRDGSVAVIESPDHELIAGYRTGTTESIVPTLGFGSGQGYDLYEYSGGRLAQVNVYSDGKTIGKCGAELVQGREGAGIRGKGQAVEGGESGLEAGSVNAVSASGTRVFFEAFPNGCPSGEEESHRAYVGGGEPKIELYMRENGSKTVDIGDYTFEGANLEGTQLFLSKEGPGGLEFFSYDTETKAAKRLFSLQGDALGLKHALSEDGNVFYFEAAGVPLSPEAPANESDLYRYDIPSETISFVAVAPGIEGDGNGGFYASPDGSSFYFNVPPVQGVGGSSSGAVEAYRYDSSENVVQCVSCASPYNPEPKLLSTFMPEYGPSSGRFAPLGSPASANGDYVFFDTPAALVPQDVNGEISPQAYGGSANKAFFFSPSSDVYEWRRDGVGGCGRVQGCVALITNGIDGLENVLLGTDPSGTDVFIGTHSQLALTDTDQFGDVYDVRISGGFAPPPPLPTECEGDACSTPASAPNDTTPSSFTFSGPGDVTPLLPPAPASSPAGVVKCARGKVAVNGRCAKRKPGAKARSRSGRGAKARRSSGKTGRSGR